MSEQKLVSPLLDGFQVGDPISGHDGVRCCPAIKENSDNKYIVKILSIPASQSQLDALLLAGAFQDAAGALEYFKDLADGVVQEVKLHQQLARLDGFVPCDAWQVVPMDDNQLGYEVYLLTPYHRTLERHLKKTPLTHLEAVNLGLDLCAALTASRRAGFLYVDLKPSNIFIASDREFLIGDLGFIRMDSLKYATLPAKYFSGYTAPEMADDFATISNTADIYALGLILYQVYNDGQLPQPSEDGLVAAPANADYEMAEIILKACAADPAERWQDPAQMGQALVAYMKRNTVNDVPIMPPDLTAQEPEEEEAPAGETEETEEIQAAEKTVAEETVEEASVEEESVQEEIPAEEETEEETTLQTVEETPVEEAAPEAEDEAVPAEEEPTEEESTEEEPAEEESIEAEEITEEAPAEEASEEETAAEEETAPEAEPQEQCAQEAPVEEGSTEEALVIPGETEAQAEAEEALPLVIPQDEETEAASSVAEELAFIDELESDEETGDAGLEDTAISEETTAILAQAEELVSHEIPEPVVIAPIQIPDEEPASEDQSEDEDEEANDEVTIPVTLPDLEPVKKKGRKWFVTAILLILLAAAGYAGSHYYTNYYLVPVESIALTGGCDTITAQISVPFDERKITAVCTDTYGNTVTSPVVSGQAYFDGLNPGTQYTVTLRVNSFNQLTGNCSASFTTDQQIKLVSISATTGSEDGSVILSFTVDGYDPQNWTVEYAAEGGEPETMSFTGHMVTIPGLTVGETYTFQLSPAADTDVDLVGQTTLEYTVSPVILAQDVAIQSFEEGVLTVGWTAPADAEVASWTVRCTADGYDQTVTVTEPVAEFAGAETGKTYTVEILADGMTQSSRTELASTPLSMSNLEAVVVNDESLRVTWEYTGDAPAGWSVSYTIDGHAMQAIARDTNAADLSLLIPGATYEISVSAVDTDVADAITFQAPAADKYEGHGFTTAGMSYSFCLTPDADNWTYEDVEEYGSNQPAGKSISMVVYAKESVEASDDQVRILYVVRNSEGKVMPDLCRAQTKTWNSLWNERYFYPTMPGIIKEAGTYSFEVYFDGALALKKNLNLS